MSAIDNFYGIYRRSPIRLQNAMVTASGFVLHRRRTGPVRAAALRFLMDARSWPPSGCSNTSSAR